MTSQAQTWFVWDQYTGIARSQGFERSSPYFRKNEKEERVSSTCIGDLLSFDDPNLLELHSTQCPLDISTLDTHRMSHQVGSEFNHKDATDPTFQHLVRKFEESHTDPSIFSLEYQSVDPGLVIGPAVEKEQSRWESHNAAVSACSREIFSCPMEPLPSTFAIVTGIVTAFRTPDSADRRPLVPWAVRLVKIQREGRFGGCFGTWGPGAKVIEDWPISQKTQKSLRDGKTETVKVDGVKTPVDAGLILIIPSTE
jgi:hypothetical protein